MLDDLLLFLEAVLVPPFEEALDLLLLEPEEVVFFELPLELLLPLLAEADLELLFFAVLPDEELRFEADFLLAVLLPPLEVADEREDLPDDFEEDLLLLAPADLEEDFRLPPEEDFEEDDFFGTFSPFSLASDKPIAIACFLEVTFLPLLPLFNLPSCISCITFSTFFPAPFEYLAIV